MYLEEGRVTMHLQKPPSDRRLSTHRTDGDHSERYMKINMITPKADRKRPAWMQKERPNHDEISSESACE